MGEPDLEKLLPGDTVLADQEFDIAEDLAIRQAKLEVPAFTRGQSQLLPVEVQRIRELANV